MRLRTRVRQDRPADVPVAGDALAPSDPAVRLAAGDLEVPLPGDVELPAPARLALTAGWNLAESLGLPLLAYAVVERLGGQGLGMAAAAMVWVTAAIRKVLTGSIPGLLVISGLVLTLQTVLVLATGSVTYCGVLRCTDRSPIYCSAGRSVGRRVMAGPPPDQFWALLPDDRPHLNSATR